MTDERVGAPKIIKIWISSHHASTCRANNWTRVILGGNNWQSFMPGNKLREIQKTWIQTLFPKIVFEKMERFLHYLVILVENRKERHFAFMAKRLTCWDAFQKTTAPFAAIAMFICNIYFYQRTQLELHTGAAWPQRPTGTPTVCHFKLFMNLWIIVFF